MFRKSSIAEARSLIALAIPVYLGQIAQIAMSFVDTVLFCTLPGVGEHGSFNFQVGL